MKFKKILPFVLLIAVIFSSVSSFPVFANDNPIELYIDGVKQKMKSPLIEANDTVYVPLVETFFKVGVYMEWNEKEGCWYGKGNNGEIRITPGKYTADVDWVDVELPAPVIEKDGVCMIPIYLIEDALKVAPAVYDEGNRSVSFNFPDINYKYKETTVDMHRIISSLPEGEDLMDEGQLFSLMYDNGKESIKYDVIEIDDADLPFKKAAQIETLPLEGNVIPSTSYSIQMHTIVPRTFNAGDVGLMTFWARATKITDESGTAGLRPAYEQLDLWNKAQSQTIRITDEWEKYYLPVYSKLYTLEGGHSHVTFSVGFKPQILQIADMHIYNYHDAVSIETLDPSNDNPIYKGLEDDALWRKEAYRRLEKYRKNDLIVRVRDENGKPVPNVNVSADMTDQEFMMGVAICDNEMIDINEGESKIGDLRFEVINDLTNTGVCGLEMKSQRLEDFGRAGIRMVNKWIDIGNRIRGHAQTWDYQAAVPGKTGTNPEGADKLSYEEVYNNIYASCAAQAQLYKGKITQWDGLNEPTDSNKLRNKYGTKIYSDIFQLTKAIDPKSKLYVNETGMQGHNDRSSVGAGSRAQTITGIVDKMINEERAPVDGMGIQGHCINYFYPQGFYADIDKLAQHVDEVSITEYDFLNTDYSSAPEQLRDYFLATISHPKTTAFIIWGYQDAMHWRQYGPFYDRGWNAKPELAEWRRMLDEYYSNETAITDENGNAVLRGYRGKYDITVKLNGSEKTVGFTLTDSQIPERDNYVDVTVSDGKIKDIKVSNPLESYAKGHVEYRDTREAYAAYLASVADGELVGIYRHYDNSKNTVPKLSDGLMNTYWYGSGNDYVEFELCKEATFGDVTVDFRAVNGEVYNYRILSSQDGKTWENIYEGKSSENATVKFKNSMFIRVQSVDNEYMGLSEVNINAKKAYK